MPPFPHCHTCGRDVPDLRKLPDLKTRAATQASIGNYWAAKCLWLIGLVADYEAELGCDWCGGYAAPEVRP